MIMLILGEIKKNCVVFLGQVSADQQEFHMFTLSH